MCIYARRNTKLAIGCNLGVHDSLSHAVAALKQQEEDSLQKLKNLEDALHERIEVRLENLERSLKVRIDDRASSSGGGWFYPFLLFALTVTGVAAAMMCGGDRSRRGALPGSPNRRSAGGMSMPGYS